VTGQAQRVAPLVLVVDDFRDGRELLAELLAHAGYRTAEAATGHEALDKARALQPDLMLLDLSLPGVDGWEIARRLKGDAATRGIIIFALTAHATSRPLERAREAGCDEVLTKPCAPDALLEQVKAALMPRVGRGSQRARKRPEGSA
jgi:two-component system, cell cycle response regulator DivK